MVNSAFPDLPQCRFCRNNLAQVRFTVVRPPERRGEFRQCAHCGGLSFWADPPVTAYVEAYYGDGRAKFQGVVARMRQASVEKRARETHRQVGRAGTCLDIGCGDGQFLLAMQRRGWDVHGSELPGPAYQRAITSLPGKITAGGNFDRGEAWESFDLITLWQVFEHLEDPQAALKTIRRLLKPGGWLVIAVPNPESWQARLGGVAWLHLDPPRHLFLTSPKHFHSLLESNGFEVKAKKYPWLEFGVVGVIQTVFNELGLPRDELLDCLRTKWRNVTRAKKLFYLFGIAFLGLPATLFALAEAGFAASATYELYARRRLERTQG